MMPIKGLFNRNENNEDEIQILKKRVHALEQRVNKINTLDVHMKRLLKLESKWQKESFSSKYGKSEHQELPQKDKKEESNQREAFTAMEKRFYLQIYTYISQSLAPIQEKINRMEDQITGLENDFAMMKESIEENRQQTMELKSELEKMKTASIPKKKEEQPVVIREIKVDKILLDKYEQNNNFANLGIKDLGGQLNIGATYGTSTLPAEIAEDIKADFESFKQDSEMDETENIEEESGGEAGEESSEDSSWDSSMESGEKSNNDQKADDDDGYFTDIPIK
ncbi:hypothetical protein QNH23_04450 [Siminovitchia fortis]|nr:hypothetical protein [Siminovitchia fortis]WHY82643.1 hypothetical protein QNH23_04450 [Siminovitchia fortis]